MADKEPLLDSTWLLGEPEPSRRWHRWLISIGTSSFIIALSIFWWPYLSTTWLRQQLAAQYLSSSSPEDRTSAMIALSALLPQSLTTVVNALSRTESADVRAACEVLNDYLARIQKMDREPQRAACAELAFALEQALPNLSSDALESVQNLAYGIQTMQQQDNHPGAMMTMTACQRIMHRTSLVEGTAIDPPSMAVAMTDRLAAMPTLSTQPVTASLSDSTTSEVEKSSHVEAAMTAEAFAASSNDRPAIQMTIQSPRGAIANSNNESLPSNETRSAENESASGSLRQKWLQSSRLIPAAGNVRFPIESTKVDMSPTSYASDSSSPAMTVVERGSAMPAGTVSSGSMASIRDEDVIGIRRQKTMDLVRLLTSVQPRVVAAAFHELQRERLNREELELAVELAQGDSQQRIESMEKLIKNPKINPIAWLVWMGSEADRDVRFKAVSMLAELNSDDARLQLRLMNGRERDAEISRHIQHALLASQSPVSSRSR